MSTTSLSSLDRSRVLKFAASFAWADLEIADSERAFLHDLATELELDESEVTSLIKRPPTPEEIDPNEISPRVANAIRQAALRTIAADGVVHDSEMQMFELLDDLLPR